MQQKSARSGQLNVRSFKRFIGREARLFTRAGSSGGSCFRRLSLLFATLPDNVRVPRSQYIYTHTHTSANRWPVNTKKNAASHVPVSCLERLSRTRWNRAEIALAIPVPVEAETRGGLVPTTRVVGLAPN